MATFCHTIFVCFNCYRTCYLFTSHCTDTLQSNALAYCMGGTPGVVVKSACLGSRRSRVRTPPGSSSCKETKCFFSAHSYIFNIVGSLRDRQVACSASNITLFILVVQRPYGHCDPGNNNNRPIH